ncbi:hypothetical protein [Thalassomonas sp. RHCl1]|uniref:hypothetical protein n=1 Tax=Thalassomonas sp. RHCl1 TaxID=2995320 RepID=UPI00248C65AB|nr:hypothetical protein [Thalassomonas sp. RHCl1]
MSNFFNIKFILYITGLVCYFFTYYNYINEMGAYTYTLIVFFLSLPVMYSGLIKAEMKVDGIWVLKKVGVFLFAFLIVFSKQREDIIRAILDSILIAFFFLAFLKLKKI